MPTNTRSDSAQSDCPVVAEDDEGVTSSACDVITPLEAGRQSPKNSDDGGGVPESSVAMAVAAVKVSKRCKRRKCEWIMCELIAPHDRKWLRIWKGSLNFGMLLLIVAYCFYIVGLFKPILFLERGEFTDASYFQPFSETLPHSLVTLYAQKAYFTVAVAAIFSITLPFVKMIVTSVAYFITIIHRDRQLKLFYGSNSRGSFNPGTSQGQQPCENVPDEDDGYIKHTRDCLLLLRLISKFQMVDVVILLVNIIFLRCAFLWVKAGPGLFCLIAYCLFSILGAQMIYWSVEGERDIFQYWHAASRGVYPSYAVRFFKELDQNDSGIRSNKWYISEEFVCIVVGINILTCVSLMTDEKLMTVLFTFDATKILGVDATSLTFREVLVYLQGIEMGKLAVGVLFFMCIVVPMTMALLFLAGIFSLRQCKAMGLVATTKPGAALVASAPTYGVPNAAAVVPTNNRGVNAVEGCQVPKYDNNTGGDDWALGYTKFLFLVCNFLSEWACGDVLALGIVAAFFSMTTADRVSVIIPPKKNTSAMIMMLAYGVSSFTMCAIFYLYNLQVKFQLGPLRKLMEQEGHAYGSRSFEFSGDGGTSLDITRGFSLPYVSSHNRYPDGHVLRRFVARSSVSRFRPGNDTRIFPPATELDQGLDPKRVLPIRLFSSQSASGSISASEKSKHSLRFLKCLKLGRLFLYSNVFSSGFFGLVSIAMLLLLICAYTYNRPMVYVQPNAVNEFIQVTMKESIHTTLKVIPNSYGHCNSTMGHAPMPCRGHRPLYHRNSHGVAFTIPWISGLNTFRYMGGDFSVIGKDKRLNLQLHFGMEYLQIFLQLGICKKGKCKVLYRGPNFFSGKNVTISITISAQCKAQTPQLRDIRIDDVRMENVKFVFILDFLISRYINVPVMISRWIKYFANRLVTSSSAQFKFRGVSFDPMEMINLILAQNFPENIICPK